MPEAKRPLKVFLCHARADKQKVRELYRYLRKRGIQPWLDAEDLVGGQDWRVEIPKAIRASDAIIICLSKNSINKEGFVQREIAFALEKALEIPAGRSFIIPARFEECDVPDSLERFHWVDLFEEDGFRRLMRSLRTRASQLERATVNVPESYESSPDLTSSAEAGRIAVEEPIQNEERSIVDEKAEHETAEKSAQETAERERAEKAAQEKLEREAAEKAAQEKAKREAAEKAERDRVEKARQEETERKIAENALRDKAKSDAAEHARREREKWWADRKAEVGSSISTSWSTIISFTQSLKRKSSELLQKFPAQVIAVFVGLPGLAIVAISLLQPGDLYFTSDQNGKTEIYKLVDGTPVRVTHTPEKFDSWGPIIHGQNLYFTSNRSNLDQIYLLGSEPIAMLDISSWTDLLNAKFPEY